MKKGLHLYSHLSKKLSEAFSAKQKYFRKCLYFSNLYLPMCTILTFLTYSAPPFPEKVGKKKCVCNFFLFKFHTFKAGIGLTQVCKRQVAEMRGGGKEGILFYIYWSIDIFHPDRCIQIFKGSKMSIWRKWNWYVGEGYIYWRGHYWYL